MYEISAIPIEEQREDEPDFTIDPMYSGTQDDGGEHRKERHRELDGPAPTPAEQATWDAEVVR